MRLVLQAQHLVFGVSSLLTQDAFVQPSAEEADGGCVVSTLDACV